LETAHLEEFLDELPEDQMVTATQPSRRLPLADRDLFDAGNPRKVGLEIGEHMP
jgi:hypothetical protein